MIRETSIHKLKLQNRGKQPSNSVEVFNLRKLLTLYPRRFLMYNEEKYNKCTP